MELSDEVVSAPSIGPKTARRLQRIGVKSVADLLHLDADVAAAKIAVRHITPQAIRDWQNQAKMVCQVPWLRGHDAQLIVACDVRDARSLAAARPQQLFAQIERIVNTSDGQRILRSGKRPDRAEVTEWIQWAQQSRSMKAA